MTYSAEDDVVLYYQSASKRPGCMDTLYGVYDWVVQLWAWFGVLVGVVDVVGDVFGVGLGALASLLSELFGQLFGSVGQIGFSVADDPCKANHPLGIVCGALVSAVDQEGDKTGPEAIVGVVAIVAVFASVFGADMFDGGTAAGVNRLAMLLVLLAQVMEINAFFRDFGILGTKFAARAGVMSGLVTHMLGAYSVVFVALKGFTLMRGSAQGSMQELMYSAGKYIAIWGLAGGVGAMQETLIGSFNADGTADKLGLAQYMMNSLTDIIAGNSGDGPSASSGIDSSGGTVDKMNGFTRQLRYILEVCVVLAVFLSKIMSGTVVTAGTGNAASAAGDPVIVLLTLVGPLFGSVLSFIVSTLSVLLLCKLAWGMLMAFAPLFIFSLAFKPTASLFRSWANNVFYTMLLQALVYWIARYFFMKHVIIISVLGLVNIVLVMTKLSPIEAYNAAFILSIQASLIGFMGLVVTAFLPRIVGALTNTNAVSGFEQMGGLMSGGLDKAVGGMKEMMKDASSKETPLTKDDGTKNTTPGVTDTNKAADASGQGKGKDGGAKSETPPIAAQTIPTSTGPNSTKASTSGSSTAQGKATNTD